MRRLDGKVGVITAATSGMALATAKLFVDEGAYVFTTLLEPMQRPRLRRSFSEVKSAVPGRSQRLRCSWLRLNRDL